MSYGFIQGSAADSRISTKFSAPKEQNALGTPSGMSSGMTGGVDHQGLDPVHHSKLLGELHKTHACGFSLGWSEENILDSTDATHLWIIQQAVSLCGIYGTPTAAGMPPPVVSTWIPNNFDTTKGASPQNSTNAGAPTASNLNQIAVWLNYTLSKSNADPFNPWPNNTMFYDALVRGLFDADHQNPWFNGGSWQCHFLDPHIMQSYTSSLTLGKLNKPVENRADLISIKAMNLAIAAYQNMFGQAGDGVGGVGFNIQNAMDFFYYIGLVLHYFTDMTQPMHSHNYPVTVKLTKIDKFHEKFEIYAQQYINTKSQYCYQQPTPITAPTIPPVGTSNPFLVHPSLLCDQNSWYFGGANSLVESLEDIPAATISWIVSSAWTGWNRYQTAYQSPCLSPSTFGVTVPSTKPGWSSLQNWSVGPSTVGVPLQPGGVAPTSSIPVGNKTLDDEYVNTNMFRSPAPPGFTDWKHASNPVVSSQMITSILATTGFLNTLLNLWFPQIMWDGGVAGTNPRALPARPTNQMTAFAGCQCVYQYEKNPYTGGLFGGEHLGVNLYTGAVDPNCRYVPNSRNNDLSLLGNFGVVQCINPSVNLALEAGTCFPAVSNAGSIGYNGDTLPACYSNSASVLGCAKGVDPVKGTACVAPNYPNQNAVWHA